MRLFGFILIVGFLFSCVQKEENVVENLDLNATVQFQTKGVNLQHYYLEIQKDTFRQIARYPEYDSTNNPIKTYEFSSLNGGKYTLSVKSYFGYSYDTTINIKDSLSVIKLSSSAFKEYVDSFDVNTFFEELKRADTVHFAQYFRGCFTSSEEFFNVYSNKNKNKIEFSFGDEFDLNFDYKKRLIRLIKRQEKYKNGSRNNEVSFIDNEGNSIIILDMGCMSTSHSYVYINLDNKIYELNSRNFECDDEGFNFLTNNFSSSYLKHREKVSVYLPITAKKQNSKALILSKKYIPFYDKNLYENDRYSYWEKPIIEIDSISERKINFKLSDDTCDLFNLVKTVDNKNNQWISGEYVYEFNKTGRDSSFTIQNIDFKLNITQNFGVEVIDENGLTFCSSSNPVVLYNSKYSREDLVNLDKDSFDYPTNHLTLDASDSWRDEIKGIKYKNDSLILEVRREYQEGYENFTFLIEISKNQTKGKILSSKMILE